MTAEVGEPPPCLELEGAEQQIRRASHIRSLGQIPGAVGMQSGGNSTHCPGHPRSPGEEWTGCTMELTRGATAGKCESHVAQGQGADAAGVCRAVGDRRLAVSTATCIGVGCDEDGAEGGKEQPQRHLHRHQVFWGPVQQVVQGTLLPPPPSNPQVFFSRGRDAACCHGRWQGDLYNG